MPGSPSPPLPLLPPQAPSQTLQTDSDILDNIREGKKKQAVKLIIAIATMDGGNIILEDVAIRAIAEDLVVEAADTFTCALEKGGMAIEVAVNGAVRALFLELKIQSMRT